MAFRNLPEMPCGPILELHGQRKRFHVPYGLKRLLEDMTKEVLRQQPDNVYDFLANFMETRREHRKSENEHNKHRKSWQIHHWSWEEGSILNPEDLRELIERLHLNPEQTEHYAVVIQSGFRGYQARKKVKEIRNSIGLEGGVRFSMGGTPRKSDGDNTVDDLENLTADNATAAEVKSAVVIQSAFRSHQKKLQDDGQWSPSKDNMTEPPESETESAPPSLETGEVTKAEEPTAAESLSMTTPQTDMSPEDITAPLEDSQEQTIAEAEQPKPEPDEAEEAS